MCKTCTTFSARPSLQNDMDGGVAAALIEEEAEQRSCPDLDAHWRLDEAQETIQRLTQERDEARADLAEYVQAQALRTQPRPLTPDAITADAYERGVPVLRAAPQKPSVMVAHETVRAIVAAVLTEPPARPEGLTRLIDTIREATYNPEPVATGEALYNAGVRVVTEEQP